MPYGVTAKIKQSALSLALLSSQHYLSDPFFLLLSLVFIPKTTRERYVLRLHSPCQIPVSPIIAKAPFSGILIPALIFLLRRTISTCMHTPWDIWVAQPPHHNVYVHRGCLVAKSVNHLIKIEQVGVHTT